MTETNNSKRIVAKWIRESCDYDLEELFESLGYKDADHLANTIVKHSPKHFTRIESGIV